MRALLRHELPPAHRQSSYVCRLRRAASATAYVLLEELVPAAWKAAIAAWDPAQPFWQRLLTCAQAAGQAIEQELPDLLPKARPGLEQRTARWQPPEPIRAGARALRGSLANSRTRVTQGSSFLARCWSALQGWG